MMKNLNPFMPKSKKTAGKTAGLIVVASGNSGLDLPTGQSGDKGNLIVQIERNGTRSKIKEQIRKWRKTVALLINFDSSKN